MLNIISSYWLMILTYIDTSRINKLLLTLKVNYSWHFFIFFKSDNSIAIFATVSLTT
jgi:hypothetical protein